MPANAHVPVQILFDIGPAVHQRAGLSRYAERLAASLVQYAKDDVSLSVVYNRHSGHSLPASLQSVSQFTLPLGQYAWRLSVLASQMSHLPYLPIESQLRALQKRSQSATGIAVGPAVYHASEHLLPRLSGPTVLTVHDLIFARFPQHHTWMNRLFLKAGMPLFLRSATAIIAVSHHTKRDLLATYNIPASRVEVIHQGIEDDFRPATEAERARVRKVYSPGSPYLLMVGTLEPRKGHVTAIRSLARLKSAGYPHRLIVAGEMGWMFDAPRRLVADLNLEDRVSFAGHVPYNDLSALYSAADCFLMPSLYEGFGFPVLEAMACGTPAVCSNTGSLPEIAGDAALLVAPNDHDSLANAVCLILDQPAFANAMREAGLARAARFRWDTCAQRTLDIYRTVASFTR